MGPIESAPTPVLNTGIIVYGFATNPAGIVPAAYKTSSASTDRKNKSPTESTQQGGLTESISDESAVVSRCLETGNQQLLQGRVFSAESVSKSLYETGLKLARYGGVLDSDMADARRNLHREFRRINARLDQILSVTLAAGDE